jgi:hypothetical protein
MRSPCLLRAESDRPTKLAGLCSSQPKIGEALSGCWLAVVATIPGERQREEVRRWCQSKPDRLGPHLGRREKGSLTGGVCSWQRAVGRRGCR